MPNAPRWKEKDLWESLICLNSCINNPWCFPGVSSVILHPKKNWEVSPKKGLKVLTLWSLWTLVGCHILDFDTLGAIIEGLAKEFGRDLIELSSMTSGVKSTQLI